MLTDRGLPDADVPGRSGLVEVHVGTFALASPAGGPTTLTVSQPCGS